MGMETTKIVGHHKMVLDKLTERLFAGPKFDQRLYGLYTEAFNLFQGKPVYLATVIGYRANVTVEGPNGTTVVGRVARATHEPSGTFVQLAGVEGVADAERLQLTAGQLFAAEQASGDGTTAVRWWTE
jgi:hypothetical protein